MGKEKDKVDGWFVWVIFLVITIYSIIFQVHYMVNLNSFPKGFAFQMLGLASSYMIIKTQNKWMLFK